MSGCKHGVPLNEYCEKCFGVSPDEPDVFRSTRPYEIPSGVLIVRDPAVSGSEVTLVVGSNLFQQLKEREKKHDDS